ncbi:MAG: hypothetical protein JXQ73_02405 [Phycisphaerae bacterium]|nr:hypothetical protein [Phycisphaerae bacterium]
MPRRSPRPKTPVIRLEVQVDFETYGWAAVLIQTKDRALEIACSYLGGDTVADMARGFAELIESPNRRVEVSCYGEPGDSTLKLKRRDDDLEIGLKRYAWEGDGAPKRVVNRAMRSTSNKHWQEMLDGRHKPSALNGIMPFRDALAMFCDSIQKAVDKHGAKAYEASWGFPWPSKELAAIRRFLDDTST